MLRLPILLLTLLLAAAMMTPGCKSAEDLDAARTDPTELSPPSLGGEDGPDPEDIVSAVGTVRYVDLEGGFYGIETDDGGRYNPSNLAAEYQEDGMTVRFRAVRQEDVMTTQMWGTPVEILDIARVTVMDE